MPLMLIIPPSSSQGRDAWLEALSAAPPPVVDHFIFIMRNTLNPTCLERCLGAVVAVLHAEQQQQQHAQEQRLQQQRERPEAPCPTTQASILAPQLLGAGLLETLVQV